MKRIFLGVICLLSSLSVLGQSTLHVSKQLFKDQFLESINNTRAKGCNCGATYMPPAPPLSWNELLTNSANGHAADMAYKNYFSHESQDGRTLRDRILASGYGYTGYRSWNIGENIASGQRSITEVSDGWFSSVGHCKNLMNPAFKEVGIAEVNHYWVQDFGGRVPFSDEQKKIIKNGGRVTMRTVK